MHRGAQHAAERIKLPIFEADRIEPGQTPILSRRVENVRRRTDGGSGQDGILVAPCVKTVVAHADGDIQIKPNWQIPRASAGSTKIELLVSDPLHELDKADIRLARTPPQPLDGLVIDSSPFVRPFPPGTDKLPAHHLEARKAGERGATLLSEMIEGLTSFRGAMRPKRLVCELERRVLTFGNPVVVDNAIVPKPFDLVRQPGRVQSGKFRHRCDVDIKWIEKEAAVGKIWTCLVCTIIEQSMQRVESDARCAEIGGEVDEA